MEPHQQRVVAEEAELSERLDKLKAFINNGTIYPTLPADERSRLVAQAQFMTEYRNVLRDRIAAFGA